MYCVLGTFVQSVHIVNSVHIVHTAHMVYTVHNGCIACIIHIAHTAEIKRKISGVVLSIYVYI